MEVIVVISIFTVLVGVGLFMSVGTLQGSIYRSEVGTIVSLMQKARSRAMANMDQSPWGVCYIAPNYVSFKGPACIPAAAIDSFAAHQGVAATSDFAHTFPSVVFSQVAGTTTAVSFTVVQNGRSSNIQIKYEGTIIW